MFHITNCLTLETCRQKLNKRLSNNVTITVKKTNIKIVFPPFKAGDLFSVKESEPKYLRFFFFYRFTTLGCNASFIDETTHHLTTRIEEYLETQNIVFLNISALIETVNNCLIVNVLRSYTPLLVLID